LLRAGGGRAQVGEAAGHRLGLAIGFLHVEGLTARALAGSVPSVAGWRLAGLPRGLDAERVRYLLDSCDRSTVAGRRDFAILTMLVRLGMRSGEVARLELDDLDWRSGELVVRGKGDRVERLPLPADVGEAIVEYCATVAPRRLRSGRCSCASRRRAGC
jgi:integrase/recombinase XerD